MEWKESLREALLNAVVHKDYASSIPIQISVYPDKLMIWNPAQQPQPWTPQRLLAKHASMPANPDVANTFFRAGMIESWGRGIERMVEACRLAGLAEPAFSPEVGGFWVTFAFAQPQGYEAATATVSEKTRVETPVKTRVETPVKTSEQILAALKAMPSLTLAELAPSIGKSLSAVERAAAKLVKEQKLRFVGPKKGGHWEVLK